MTATDRWIVGQTDDGRYIVREENDGWAYLHSGPEAQDTWLTREELERQHPGLYESTYHPAPRSAQMAKPAASTDQPTWSAGGVKLSADDIKQLSVAKRCEFIKAWFLEHYEDPAENTPYESAEGGYIYIWGGPYEADDVITEAFFGVLPEEVLLELAKEIVQETGVLEWASPDDQEW